MRSLYFAWVRERIGKTEEDIAPPASVRTVADLIGWLTSLGEGYAYAFENPRIIRAALDHRHVRHENLLGEAREIAFFPPMTGG